MVVIQYFDPTVWKSSEVPADAVMPEGEHHQHDHPAEVVNRRYATYESSPLVATVETRDENAIELKVESAKPINHHNTTTKVPK